jgi:tetratricopeptide (TPR) repeat protein
LGYQATGKLDLALPLFEETLKLEKAKLGADHSDTLACMHNLASTYAALSRQAEALKLREEMLALAKAKLGPDHPETLNCMYSLALSYAAVGRHAEALQLHEEALALRKAKLGPDHPDTFLSMWGLASSLVALDRGAEAVPIIDECLKRALGQLAHSRHPPLIPGVTELRLRHFKKVKDAAGCRATAEMWEQLNRSDADSLYNSARWRAVTAAVDKQSSGADADRHAVEDADCAIDWLRKAVAAGYTDAAHVRADKDLDVLRDRKDFKKLLAELEVKTAKSN